jgi:MarR family transcriptional regulator, organic hydroperoxide resistance regulator
MKKNSFSNHIGYYVQEIARKSSIALNEELEVLGITYAQFRVINCIWKKGPLSQKEILKTISVSPPTLTGTVDILEKKKLVFRKPEEEDARTKKIHLTEEGNELQEKAWDIIDNFEERTTGFMSKKEKKLVLAAMKQMEKSI